MNWNHIVKPTHLFAIMACCLVLSACNSTNTDTPKSTDMGEFVYQDYCQDCHGDAGAGTDEQTVIAGRDVWNNHPDTLVKTLVFGWANSGQGAGNVLRAMPPIPYTDEQIAAVAVHVMKTIGSRKVTVTEADVKRVRFEHQRELQQRLSR